MGKKSKGKNYTSKGERRNVRRDMCLVARSERKSDLLGHNNNLLKEWRKFRNPWLTIENPNTNETNRKYIRVRANDYWGHPKDKRPYTMGSSAPAEG